MTNVNAVVEKSQVEIGVKNEHPPSVTPSSTAIHGGSKVYKSGPLFLSSKGIGWTSWKKRWFILTQTSLVFYRSDPNVVPQKAGEVNLTLGGIDLNSSGSVVVKEDKKLITVLFTDGRDGRTFTLKAETLDDLHEWKFALEEALSNAPNAPHVVGQNGVFKKDQSNAADVTSEQTKDRSTVAKSLVTGRPILLALEDIDGTPSFLEKALRFIEGCGVKTEGILRQAADVEDVERRIQEYEKGKNEFGNEDPHIIADCIKYVLRELPSPPVPASCCKALLEAYRSDRSMRVNTMRTAICETFPEPNRRLLQRILTMMQAVASQKSVNRMSISAVAACMAPLLLRPLLAGDCDIDNDFDVGGDGSVQLLQAAAAANHAQAIVITLLEEYHNVFGDGAVTHEPYTDSEESGSESEEITDGDDSFDEYDDDGEEISQGSISDVDQIAEHESVSAGSSRTGEDGHSTEKVYDPHSPVSDTREENVVHVSSQDKKPEETFIQHDATEGHGNIPNSVKIKPKADDISESLEANTREASLAEISWELPHRPARNIRRPAALGRNSAKKNLSMESIELPLEDEVEIEKMGSAEKDLNPKVSSEAIAKAILLDTLEIRKRELRERRVALEKYMKAELEEINRAEADIENLKKQADDLDSQLKEQHERNAGIGQHQNVSDHHSKTREKQFDDGATLTASTSEKPCGVVKETDAAVQYPKGTDTPNSTNVPPNPKAKETALNSKATRISAVASAADPASSKSGTTTIRKSSGTRTEGSSSTTSALSKLTNRLNFLKERSSQIASELQSMDKSLHSTQPVLNSPSAQPKGSIIKFDRHQEPKPLQLSEKRLVENERNEPRNAGTVESEDGNQSLDWGRSESYSTIEDKGHHSKFTPRTYSR